MFIDFSLIKLNVHEFLKVTFTLVVASLIKHPWMWNHGLGLPKKTILDMTYKLVCTYIRTLVFKVSYDLFSYQIDTIIA
jgi:hypothetical protein